MAVSGFNGMATLHKVVGKLKDTQAEMRKAKWEPDWKRLTKEETDWLKSTYGEDKWKGRIEAIMLGYG